MALDIASVRPKISSAINTIIDDFTTFPDKYLTEDDVRCHLVNALLDDPLLNKLIRTDDGSQSIPIHSEVRWYGESGDLNLRSDVVVFDVRTLQVKDGLVKLSSKGYGFKYPFSVIEIKLRRVNGGSDNKLVKDINADLEKIMTVRTEVQGDYDTILIVLDKKANIETKINAIEATITDLNVKILYRSAKQLQEGNNLNLDQH